MDKNSDYLNLDQAFCYPYSLGYPTSDDRKVIVLSLRLSSFAFTPALCCLDPL